MSEELITLKARPQEIVDFLNLPASPQKNIQYKNRPDGMGWLESVILKKEGNLHYSHTSYKIRRNGATYFAQKIKRDGFTVTDKGKLEIWWGSDVKTIPSLWDVLATLKIDWFDSSYHGMLTKGVLEKILAGKITNPVDLCAAWLKSQRIKASPRITYKILKTEKYGLDRILRTIQIRAKVATNQECMIQKLYEEVTTKKHGTIMDDLVEQAMLLNEKINFAWSTQRIRTEHLKWTKEIMFLEGTEGENEIVDYGIELPNIPKEFTLLSDKHSVLLEGKCMGHCVYTNYWSKIKRQAYLAYHIEINGHESTLGMKLTDNFIEFDQHYTHYNDPAHIDAQILVERWIREVVEPWNNAQHFVPKRKLSAKFQHENLWPVDIAVARGVERMHVEEDIF